MAEINTEHVLKIGQAQEMFTGFGQKTDERYLKNAEAGSLAKKSEVAKADLAAALAKIIDDVVAESAGNKSAIETLNGTAAGSVKKAIDDAFNDFATKVSDDGVVNTYKELIDYAAAHGTEYTALIGEVSALTAKLTLGKVSDEEGAAEYATVKAYVEAYVASQIAAIGIDNYATTQALNDGLGGKVDKVTGKGLSTNDFTDAYKTKIDGIEFATTTEVQAVIDGMFATAGE